MDEMQSMFAALRQSSDDKVVDAIEQLVREGEDRHLARINALAFAKQRGLDESAVIGACAPKVIARIATARLTSASAESTLPAWSSASERKPIAPAYAVW